MPNATQTIQTVTHRENALAGDRLRITRIGGIGCRDRFGIRAVVTKVTKTTIHARCLGQPGIEVFSKSTGRGWGEADPRNGYSAITEILRDIRTPEPVPVPCNIPRAPVAMGDHECPDCSETPRAVLTQDDMPGNDCDACIGCTKHETITDPCDGCEVEL